MPVPLGQVKSIGCRTVFPRIVMIAKQSLQRFGAGITVGTVGIYFVQNAAETTSPARAWAVLVSSRYIRIK